MADDVGFRSTFGVRALAREDDSTTVLEAEFRANGDRLVRLAFLILGSEADAQDAVADALARVLPKFRGGGVMTPAAYLRTAVINACRSTIRRRVRARVHAWPYEPVSHRDVALDEIEERAALLPALSALTRRQREVIVLRYYEDLDVAETAAVLGVSPSTVKTLSARARARLMSEMETR